MMKTKHGQGVSVTVAGAVIGLMSAALMPAGMAFAGPAGALRDLDRFVAAEMTKENVPGMALAVVKDGKVMQLRGYGYRDLERKLPVTSRTVFAIGSVTKSFTVLTLGSLVQRGVLEWDEPVRNYLPDFQLRDSYATERMTPRDLLTHRSGLPRHDALWYHSDYSREDYYRRLRYLQPSADFRSLYQYNNLMFTAAGYLAEKVSGIPWEKLTERAIFAPLGMVDSYAGVEGFTRATEPALPYFRGAGDQPQRVDYANIDAIGPAGSINSSIEDMSHYLVTLMAMGRWQGRQVFDARVVREMQTPQTLMSETPRHAEIGASQFGMGLMIGSYRGHRQLFHGGTIDGFGALISWLPEAGIGVVALANLNGSSINGLIAQRVYDLLLGLPPIDWSARLAAEKAAGKAARVPESEPELGLRKPGTQPAHALDAYVGTYEHPAYGVANVTRNEQGLALQYHGPSTPLKHFHYEVFEAPENVINRLVPVKVIFHTGVDGEVDKLSIKLEPAVDDIAFIRNGGSEMRARAFLQAFVGSYAMGANPVEISMRDGTLRLAVRDDPELVLQPLRGTRFRVSGRDSHSVEFLRDAQGKYDRFVYRDLAASRLGRRK